MRGERSYLHCTSLLPKPMSHCITSHNCLWRVRTCFWSKISHMEAERQRGRGREKVDEEECGGCRSFLKPGVKPTQQRLWPPHSCVFLPSLPPPDGPAQCSSQVSEAHHNLSGEGAGGDLVSCQSLHQVESRNERCTKPINVPQSSYSNWDVTDDISECKQSE